LKLLLNLDTLKKIKPAVLQLTLADKLFRWDSENVNIKVQSAKGNSNLGENNFKNKLKSKFIVLDGPDGCGKSTQANLLAQYLKEKGIEVETFRDPGTTDIGEKIRGILLDPMNKRMNPATEVLLYMAARVQLWNEEIDPALKNNKTVILDRWLSSTCAYQGFAGEFGIDNVIKIAEKSLPKPWPNLTIILDIDLETASKRLGNAPDRIEQKEPEYHRNVRKGFLELAEKIKNANVLNAAESVNEVHKNIIRILENC